MAYAIEKNIPLAPIRGRKKAQPRCKYPLPAMKRGDSFTVGRPAKRQKVAVSVALTYWGKKLKAKYALRTLEDKTVRVWRVR